MRKCLGTGTLSYSDSALIIFRSWLFHLVLIDIEGLDCVAGWCVTSEPCSPCCHLVRTFLRSAEPRPPLVAELLRKPTVCLPVRQDPTLRSVPATDHQLGCGLPVCCPRCCRPCESLDLGTGVRSVRRGRDILTGRARPPCGTHSALSCGETRLASAAALSCLSPGRVPSHVLSKKMFNFLRLSSKDTPIPELLLLLVVGKGR